MRDSPDLRPLGVVDPDLRADVATIVDLDHLRLAPGPQERQELVAGEEPLVVERDDDGGRVDRREELREGLAAATLRVEGALALAAVDPLARDPVGLGVIPADQGLPDMVVAEVRVLIVGRVDVDDVGAERGRSLRGL